MGPECRRLFVYGTLKRGGELHHHLTRLGARFMGLARATAERVEGGRYPGARPAARQGRGVLGELFELRQPSRHLRILDEVEGCIPAAPSPRRFVRAQTEVTRPGGRRERAWVYWWGAGKGARHSHG